jgi:two-component system response regulator BaeR
MPRSTILIVEDEPKIARLLNDYLQQADFSCRETLQMEEILRWVDQKAVDLVLLDWMLPNLSGLEVCQQLRAFSDIPILMITAKVEETNRLQGLKAGADDYICKPFSPREVVARVQAVLRRSSSGKAPELTVGPFRLEPESHRAFVEQAELALTPNEFGLLRTFLQRPGKVFSREDLLQHVQGHFYAGYDRTIDTHIKNLRKKLTPFALQHCIDSVYGVGYRFQCGEEKP